MPLVTLICIQWNGNLHTMELFQFINIGENCVFCYDFQREEVLELPSMKLWIVKLVSRDIWLVNSATIQRFQKKKSKGCRIDQGKVFAVQ